LEKHSSLIESAFTPFTSMYAVSRSYRVVVTLQEQRCLRGLYGGTRSEPCGL